jgi:hypothetical protein
LAPERTGSMPEDLRSEAADAAANSECGTRVDQPGGTLGWAGVTFATTEQPHASGARDATVASGLATTFLGTVSWRSCRPRLDRDRELCRILVIWDCRGPRSPVLTVRSA